MIGFEDAVSEEEYQSRSPDGSITRTMQFGSFKLTGIWEALQRGQYSIAEATIGLGEFWRIGCGPLIGNGKWQMIFEVDLSSVSVSAHFAAVPCVGETLSAAGERLGRHDISVWFETKKYTSSPTSDRNRIWKPSNIGNITHTWKISSWIDLSHMTDPDCLDLQESEEAVTVHWSIRSSSESVLGNAPVTFSEILETLFDDKETANVVFVVSNPRHGTKSEEYIYAHTKVLSARLEYFKTMFQSGFAESLSCANSSGDEIGARELEDLWDSDHEDTQMNDTVVTSAESSLKESPSFADRRIIRTTGTSYKTYRAMLYFLYTSTYAFTPLASSHLTSSSLEVPSQTEVAPSESKKRKRRNSDIEAKNPAVSTFVSTDFSCSAKSMYSLCHRLDIPELKNAALEHIKNSLTPENVVSEIRSVFSSRFAEIREMEKDYLMRHWVEVKASAAFSSLITRVFEGEPDGLDDTWLEVFRSC